MGLIDPQTQGFFLATKWIIKAVSGDEPWKILVRQRIMEASIRRKWQDVHWLDKMLFPSFLNSELLFPSSLFGKLGKKLANF